MEIKKAKQIGFLYCCPVFKGESGYFADETDKYFEVIERKSKEAKMPVGKFIEHILTQVMLNKHKIIARMS